MKTWRDYVRRVVPYTPGEQPNQPGMIKLNTNENPYPPAPGVVKMAEHLETDRFRLYPDPTASVLTEALAEFYHKAGTGIRRRGIGRCAGYGFPDLFQQ